MALGDGGNRSQRLIHRGEEYLRVTAHHDYQPVILGRLAKTLWPEHHEPAAHRQLVAIGVGALSELNSSKMEDSVNAKGEMAIVQQAVLSIAYLKQECLTCPLFEICNGCKKTISDLKRLDLVAGHCSEMQKLLPELRPYLEQ